MRLSPPPDTPVDLDRADLTSTDLYARGEPHAVWREMRRRDPVRWQSAGEAGGFWSVTRYDDVERVLRDHEAFTSQRGTLLFLLGKPDPASGHQLPATDPPRHSDMRLPLHRAIMHRSVKKHSDMIRARVRELLDVGRSGEPFDFAATMGHLPTVLIGTLMGFPREDWPRLTHLSTMAMAPDDAAYLLPDGSDATLKRAHRELFAYFQERIRERRRNPREDLLSVLLTTEVGGEPVDTGTVLSNCYSVLVGAAVTTPHVPSASLLELIRTGQYADWAAHPELTASGVEEGLRWASPANHLMRHTTRPVEIAGVPIPAGDPVVVWLGSANRDESEFDDPFRFDIRRTPNRQIAFGIGAHYCVGHGIGRLTLRIVFDELFSMFQDFELAGEVEHMRSSWLAGIKAMPVVGRPRPAARAARARTAAVTGGGAR